VGGTGLEPVTPSLSSWCSPNWANRPGASTLAESAYCFTRAQGPSGVPAAQRRVPASRLGAQRCGPSCGPGTRKRQREQDHLRARNGLWEAQWEHQRGNRGCGRV